MSDQKNIIHRTHCIEKLLSEKNFQDIEDHLKELEDVNMTVECLQGTEVTKAVYRVLKSCPSGVLKKKHLNVGPKEQLLSEGPRQQETLDGTSSNILVPSQTDKNMVSLRCKCVDLLYKALIGSAKEEEEAVKWLELAKEIEEHIFALHAKNDKKYKNCIRSKISNLKNPKNCHLKHNLFSGTLSPKAFAEMTVMEMASDELKQLRALYTKSSVQEHQLPQVINGTQTNKIKCRRCEKFDSWVRNTNPDEQMLTYVICNECGEQWYHSRWNCL
uniref:Transcription elongation factor A N-terminal and central domain containing n=1 Tax=Malurus cyaneus samueli TaxID=2593467 RepID=A0A8C5X050_9PASS